MKPPRNLLSTQNLSIGGNIFWVAQLQLTSDSNPYLCDHNNKGFFQEFVFVAKVAIIHTKVLKKCLSFNPMKI
jgi:hypothetical protein